MGEPRDLVPYARLRASGTRTFIFPWVREAEDSIAAIRDDSDLTSWKAPTGKTTTVTIDLQPWLRRPAALDSISLSYKTTPPSKVQVRLLKACGGSVVASSDWADTGKPLPLQNTLAGCVEIDLKTESDFNLDGIKLVSAESDFDLPGTAVAARTATHPGNGIVEGFYGVPWSWRERENALYLLNSMGMDSYMYAPKLDPLHRSEWRGPYPAETVARFKELNDTAVSIGALVYFGISPFIDFDFSTDADYQALLSKLVVFMDAGLTGFALLADDIEMEKQVEIDGALGKLHADTANRLLADLRKKAPDARLWFVGTVYSDERIGWQKGADYLKALTALDTSIKVMWTGRGTASAEMKGSDMDVFTASIGRKPLIWDNYWANDGGDGATGRVLLSVYGGRGPDLRPAVEGITHNPMIQGALSRLDLGMFGYWLENPASKDADASRAFSLELEKPFLLPEQPFHTGACPAPQPYVDTGIESATLLAAMKIFNGNFQHIPAYDEMEAAISALYAALDSGGPPPVEQGAALLEIFAGMYALRSGAWHSRLDPDMVDELEFPLLKVYYDGTAGLFSLAMLGKKLSGQTAPTESARASKAVSNSDQCRFVYSGTVVADFFAEINAIKPSTSGFVAPAITKPTPPACSPGKRLEWKPFDGASAVHIHGLPGAKVDGGTIIWTPPHGGIYEGVSTASTDKGWAFVPFTLACE
jgi:hypothetical protein